MSHLNKVHFDLGNFLRTIEKSFKCMNGYLQDKNTFYPRTIKAEY